MYSNAIRLSGGFSRIVDVMISLGEQLKILSTPLDFAAGRTSRIMSPQIPTLQSSISLPCGRVLHWSGNLVAGVSESGDFADVFTPNISEGVPCRSGTGC